MDKHEPIELTLVTLRSSDTPPLVNSIVPKINIYIYLVEHFLANAERSAGLWRPFREFSCIKKICTNVICLRTTRKGVEFSPEDTTSFHFLFPRIITQLGSWVGFSFIASPVLEVMSNIRAR